MADNVGYTPGTGADIAADEVDGVLYQRIKRQQATTAARSMSVLPTRCQLPER